MRWKWCQRSKFGVIVKPVSDRRIVMESERRYPCGARPVHCQNVAIVVHESPVFKEIHANDFVKGKSSNCGGFASFVFTVCPNRPGKCRFDIIGVPGVSPGTPCISAAMPQTDHTL